MAEAIAGAGRVAFADRRELAQRWVPAAAESEVLLEQYLVQQTSLRDCVTSGHPAALATYARAAAQIGGQQTRVASLVARYRLLLGQLTAAEKAHRAWLSAVAARRSSRQLAAATSPAPRRCRPISQPSGRTRWQCGTEC